MARPNAPPSAAELRAAARAVTAVAVRTPLLRCEPLSRECGHEVWLKPENLQRTGSYKVRGAYAKIHRLPAAARARGVITASAGNHAQGVALAASKVGAPAVVVMPENAPVAKVAAARDLGAEIVLCGETFEEAEREAHRLEHERRLTFIHPFDDWEVIAGQASVGLEVMADFPRASGGERLDAIVYPAGGGGLIAGGALARRAELAEGRDAPAIYGVQARGADALVRSFAGGRLVMTDQPRTIADGIRVGRPGARPWELIRQGVERLVSVPDEEIARAVVYLLERAKLLVEPASAAGVAALLSGALAFPAQTQVCAVLTGGNVDVNLVARLIEHGLTRAGRYLVLRVRLDDRPGQLSALLRPLAERRVNVLDIEHHRAGWLLPVGQSDVILHLETRDLAHAQEIVRALVAAGYAVEPLTPLTQLQ
jgi:threonine dehydratase